MKRKDSKRLQQILLALFIAMIMTTSILGFLWGRESEDQLKYNGMTFTRQQSFWVTDVNGQKKSFYNFPSQVEDITLDPGVISALGTAPMLYMTYDPNQTTAEYIAQAIFDLDMELSASDIYAIKALTKENRFGAPVISCQNTTARIPVIYFEQTNQTKIFVNDNCIIVEAKTGPDFLRARDRIFYSMFGIIK